MSTDTPSAPAPDSRVTPPVLARWKREGRKFAVLTAYDYTMARLLDEAGVDLLLVGDSMGTVVHGQATTLRVTLDQMAYHAEMVARAARRSSVVRPPSATRGPDALRRGRTRAGQTRRPRRPAGERPVPPDGRPPPATPWSDPGAERHDSRTTSCGSLSSRVAT